VPVSPGKLIFRERAGGCGMEMAMKSGEFIRLTVDRHEFLPVLLPF